MDDIHSYLDNIKDKFFEHKEIDNFESLVLILAVISVCQAIFKTLQKDDKSNVN